MRTFGLVLTLLVALVLHAAAGAQISTAPIRPGLLTATFIGNEAWHITDGEYTVMTDFPYQSGYSGYMTWDWARVPRVRDRGKLLLVTTHEHRDHFAAELMPRLNAFGVLGPPAVRRAGGKAGLAPGPDVRFGPIRVQSIPTPHASLEHYSYIIEWGGVRIYLPGDTEDATSLTEARSLEVAFVTPWMLAALQRQGAKIDARRVIVIHHEAGENVRSYQGSIVPRPGYVIALEPPPGAGLKATRGSARIEGPVRLWIAGVPHANDSARARPTDHRTTRASALRSSDQPEATRF